MCQYQKTNDPETPIKRIIFEACRRRTDDLTGFAFTEGVFARIAVASDSQSV